MFLSLEGTTLAGCSFSLWDRQYDYSAPPQRTSHRRRPGLSICQLNIKSWRAEAMADSEVSNTVLISAFCTAILICIIYFIHAHFVPHLRRSKGRARGRADTPLPYGMLPQWQVRSDPQLMKTLYHAPNPNYLDPRNSVAGSDLPRTRWSTNVQDLSRPSSIRSMPRSAKRHTRQFSLPDVPKTPNKRLSAPSLYSSTTQRTSRQKQMKRRTIDLEHTRRRSTRPISTTAVAGLDLERAMIQRAARPRSRSDSQLLNRKSVLARSHASFYGQDFSVDPISQMLSTLSATTSQSNLSPSCTSNGSNTRLSSYFPAQLPTDNSVLDGGGHLG